MPDPDNRKTTAQDWQSLLIASNQALINNGLRMAQLGPEAGTMILQWTQTAALHHAEFSARNLQLVAQLLAAGAGGKAVTESLEITARVSELANDYLKGLGNLQHSMVKDVNALGARLNAKT